MSGARESGGGGPGAWLHKVLVVDDEPDVADLTGALLSACGFATCVAYSSAEALLALRNDDGISAVFSDVMMPEMSGLELARVVRERYPRVVIVLTSGYTPAELLSERGQPYLYTAKPYMIDTVIRLLRDNLAPEWLRPI